MTYQAQAVFQAAFRSGVARAYNLSPQSNIIEDPELFYSNFQQHVAIWNPNIPKTSSSTFPRANDVVWDFPLRDKPFEPSRDLSRLCISSPFDSFGRAISCLAMPYVSLGLSGASPSDLNIAAGYGVYADVATTASNTTKAWASYLSDSGSSSPECAMNVLIQNNATLDLEGVSECMRSLCRYSAAGLKISSDVIGIGVWTAYFIQLGICFLAPILAALFRQSAKRNLLTFCPGSRSGQKGGTSTQTDLGPKPSGGRIKNLEAAFITSLVDFQKAQCYYTMATQVASTTTLNRTPVDDTVAQWEAVSTVVWAVSTLGIVTPTLILFCLRILRQRSWYMLLLTVATSIISTCVFFDPRIWSVPDHLFKNPRNSGLTNKSTDPSSLCSRKLGGDSYRWYRISAGWVFYLCGLILVFLIVDHIFSLRLPRVKNRSYLLWYSKVQRNLDRFVVYLCKRQNSVLSKAGRRKVYTFACRFVLLGMMAVCFYVLVELAWVLYRYYRNKFVSRDWSFGQIVSVAIWIPVVVDWVQLSLRGMESGSEYRMPRPYRVKRIDPSTSRPTTTPDFDSTTLEHRNSIGLENGAFFVVPRRRFATAEF